MRSQGSVKLKHLRTSGALRVSDTKRPVPTQEDVGRAVGVRKQAINNLEKGGRPSLELANRLHEIGGPRPEEWLQPAETAAVGAEAAA